MDWYYKNNFQKVSYTTELPRCILLLVGLVRSLKSSPKDFWLVVFYVKLTARSFRDGLQKEALKKLLVCDDYSDLTSPTSNQIPDKHIAISVVYDIFFLILHACLIC